MIKEAGTRAESASLWIWRRRTDGTPPSDRLSPEDEHVPSAVIPGKATETTHHQAHLYTPPVITDAQAGTAEAEPRTRTTNSPRPLETPLENITPFKGKHDVLSNFYPCQLRVFGHTFRSSEHAYQFMKAKFYGKDQLAEDICRQKSGCAVKRLMRLCPTKIS